MLYGTVLTVKSIIYIAQLIYKIPTEWKLKPTTWVSHLDPSENFSRPQFLYS